MKWFKHISDSLDDPFIFDLIQKHDAEGYLIFFGIIEIYAREFKTELGWNLTTTLPYLRRKLDRTRNKPITNVLETIKKSGKWSIVINGDCVSIFIPKFKELMDESTLKKLRDNEKSFRNGSGIIPKTAGTDLEAEADKEEYINIKAADAPFEIPTKEELSESSIVKTNGDMEKVCKQLYDAKIFPEVHAFRNKMLKAKKNEKAILHALCHCYLLAPRDPWPFCKKILDVEDGNYNEKDHTRANQ